MAPATTPPDASFTTPSIDPELPDCALAGAAAKNNTNPNTTLLLKRLNIFSPSLSRAICVCVDRGRRKNGGGASLQMAQRTEIQFESEERLNRGRSATCTMQRKGIAGRHMLRQRSKQGDGLRRAG